MNYQTHYDYLVEKYGTWKKPKGIYTERHRKLPGYLGGKYVEGNAFYMTARAHYVAHMLWAKITSDFEAWCAVKQMGAPAGRQASKMYERARKTHALGMSIRLTGDLNPSRRDDVKIKMSAAQRANPVWLGKKRLEQSERMKGDKNPAFGKSEHAKGIIAFGKNSVGKTLEEIHGQEYGSEIRARMRVIKKDVNPVWALKQYICHVCGKNIRGCGNVSQHLFKIHNLNYSEFKTLYMGN